MGASSRFRPQVDSPGVTRNHGRNTIPGAITPDGGRGNDDRTEQRWSQPGLPERRRPAREGRHDPSALRRRAYAGRLPPLWRPAFPPRFPSAAVDDRTFAPRSTAMNLTTFSSRPPAVMPV